MKRQLQIVAIVAVVIVIGAALTYEVLTSTAPGNPCAGVQTAASGVRSTENVPSVPRSSAPVVVPTLPGATGRGFAQLPAANPPHSGSGPIQVVAAENFWGSLAAQLGGNKTSVTSIVTDPNTDPHEYEANASTAIAISNAQFVIVNGVGYDDWALQLLAADNNPSQVVLNVGYLTGANVSGGIVSGNPHQWYNPAYVNLTVAKMFSDLVRIAPSDTTYFEQQYAVLNTSLGSLYGEANSIKAHFAGTEVASTESIFVYLANYTDLDLVSPPAFMEAIAEGNDPPAQSVVTFQCQLESGNVKVLVYNEQTVTPITTSLKAVAAAHNVTIVGVTETIQPPDTTFQVWMNAEYLQLYNALNSGELGNWVVVNDPTVAPRGPPTGPPVIQADHLEVGFRDKTVWRDASFGVHRGEFVAVIGPNGAGKTTLFRMLLGLQRPLRGSLSVFGEAPHRGNRRIGYVPQRHSIDIETHIDCESFVRLGVSGTQWGPGWPRRAERESSMAALRAVDAAELSDKCVGTLSGGELQRVFLAEAMVGQPEMLLLDEPLSNLDLRRSRELVALVSHLVRSRNVTTLLVAHDINPLIQCLDKVIYIANGRVATGSPGAVLTSESLTALYGVPVEVLRDSRGNLVIVGGEESRGGEHD